MQPAASAPTLPALTDAEVLAAIAAVRDRTGACSYRALARELGYSETAVRYRVQRLIGTGYVEAEPGVGGSIRLVEGESRRAISQVEVRVRVTWDPGASPPLHIEVIED